MSMSQLPTDHTSESLPPTAPVSDLVTEGLPEKPTIPDEELRQHADTLIRHLEIVGRGSGNDDFEARLTRLTTRLKERLAICRDQISGSQLTPQLELLESTRMLKAVIAGT